MKKIGSRVFSAKKAMLLASLYFTLFVLPDLFLGLEVGGNFWFVLLGSLVLGLYAFRAGSHMMQFYFIFFVFTLLFGYFIQFWVGIRFVPGLAQPTQIDTPTAAVLLLHFAGLVVGGVVYERPARRKTSLARPRSVIFIPIGILFTAALVVIGAQFGGMERMFALRASAYGEEVSAFGIFTVFVAKAAVFVFVAVAIGTMRKPIGRSSKLVLLILFVFALVVANPGNTARFVSLSGVVLVFMVYLGETERSKHLLTMLVASSYAAIVILPVTSLLRGGLDQVTMQNAFSIYSGLELSSIQLLIDGVDSVSRLPSGSYTLSGLLIIIPKSIFLAKAPALGPSIADMNGYVFTNTAVPSFFTGYVDFGLIGVFLFSALLGLVFQFAHIRRDMNLQRRSDGYRAILLACTPIIARGDLSTAMISVYAFLVAYEVMRLAARFRIVLPQTTRNTRRIT